VRRYRLAFGVMTLGFSLGLTVAGHPKEAPSQVIEWPSTGTPIFRFTFGKFKEVAAIGKQLAMTTDVTAENLWPKKISHADFVVYFYDKTKVRIGQGWIGRRTGGNHAKNCAGFARQT
jgi:hypothetical protein